MLNKNWGRALVDCRASITLDATNIKAYRCPLTNHHVRILKISENVE